MIYELREYHIYTGKLNEVLGYYRNEGIPVQKEILGNLVGYFTTDIGTVSQLVHLWAYDSLDERARRRARLQADPRWQAVLAKIQPLIHTQQNRILLPTDFSPLQ